MNVHAPGNQHVQQTRMNARPGHAEMRNAAKEGLAPTKQAESAVPAEATTAEGSKGVIRLLQAGHFGGVADVRLRINFHDQLQQGAAQNAAKAFEDAVPGLLDNLAEKVGFLGKEYGLSQQANELGKTFEDEIKALLEEAKAAQTPLSTTLANINNAFSNFLEKLEGAFASLSSPMAEDPGPDEEVAELLEEEDASSPDDQTQEQVAAAMNENGAEEAEDGLGQPGEELSAFKTTLLDLAGWFSERLGQLQNNATATQQLPPLSEPKGNGTAYAKFLEIYRSLSSGIEAADAPVDNTAARLNFEI